MNDACRHCDLVPPYHKASGCPAEVDDYYVEDEEAEREEEEDEEEYDSEDSSTEESGA